MSRYVFWIGTSISLRLFAPLEALSLNLDVPVAFEGLKLEDSARGFTTPKFEGVPRPEFIRRYGVPAVVGLPPAFLIGIPVVAPVEDLTVPPPPLFPASAERE